MNNENLKSDVNSNNLHSVECLEEVVLVVNGECEGDDDDDNESESQSLLLHNDGLSEKPEKPRIKKVHWLDHNGDNLVEIFEFEPSDSDEEDSDSCMCRIM